jgi:hypothetical protein
VLTRRVRLYSTTPWWVWLLIPVSLLIALVVSLVLRKSVDAWAWPFCAHCVEQRKRMLSATAGSGAGMVLGVALAIVSGSGLWLLLTCLGLVAVVVFSGRAGWGTISGARVTRDGAAVEVRSPAAAYLAVLPPHPGAPRPVQAPAPAYPAAGHGTQQVLPGHRG